LPSTNTSVYAFEHAGTTPTINLSALRIVDPSKVLGPATEGRRCAVRRYYTVVSGAGGFHGEIDISAHLGTHLEFPFHVKEEWKDGSILEAPELFCLDLYKQFDLDRLTALAAPAKVTVEKFVESSKK